MPPPRILALDVGDRRIGVALSDELGYTAQPLLTLHRSTPRADLKSLTRLVRRYQVATVLIGLPIHASGAASPQSLKTEAFATAFRSHLVETLTATPETAIPEIVLLDERHTTINAHALLGARRSAADRAAHTRVVDQVAATLLLEAYLHNLNPPLLPDPDA